MSTGNIEAIYPLTPVQDGILFHTLYAPDSPLYIQQYTAQLDGDLDTDAFRAAWDRVIGRHAVLRSLLTWEGRERPLQIVKGQVTAEWRIEDWTQDPESQEARLDEFLEADRARGFKLDEAPLMRFALFRLTETATQFVWSHHHIIIDGWSMGIVLDEVMRSYEALTSGAEPELGPVADYRSYVTWLHERDAGKDEQWWRRSLEGVTEATPLPIDRVTSDTPWAERHDEHVVRLDQATTSQLGEFARNNGLTINTVVRGAWSLVLARYSGRNEVIYGATVAGRPPELDGALNMVGLFINTLPIRSLIEPASTVRDWLTDLQRSQSEMAPYESTPLVDVQRWSATPQGEPLFNSLLVFENVPVPRSPSEGLSSSKVRYLQRSNYPFAVLVMPGTELEFIVLYDADRYDRRIIERLAGQLVHTVAELIADPNRQLESIDVMPPDESAEVLGEWNATDAPYPADATMYALIAAQAKTHPDDVAVVDSAESLTYSELISRAGVVAEHLAGLGVGPNDRVGIAMDRSAAMVTAIVGVLGAGAAYVPIDPEVPDARRRFLLADTSAQALITDVDGRSDDIPTITLGPGGSVVAAPGTRGAVTRAASPEDLAYVLYTSGSTGQPKGVAVTHRNLVNSTHARLHAYGEPVGRFLLLSPFHFDSSVAGIFSSLS
ncbi:MAG: AMP-binding protein, partial [Acidimicrobiia bacterium]|nr:AMP-binding protein [Acidimicrobiia bacterium]